MDMAQHTFTIWHHDGSSRQITLGTGIYHAGSDLLCDIYFHPDESVPQFGIEISSDHGRILLTPQTDALVLAGRALQAGIPEVWPPGQRLQAGRVSMSIDGLAVARVPSPEKRSFNPQIFFGISILLTVGYLLLGLMEGGEHGGASTSLTAAPTKVIGTKQAAIEIRRLTDMWPEHERPRISTSGNVMQVRLQGHVSKNLALVTYIDNFRIQLDESLSILDIPYSEETFTALGIDAYSIRPKKLIITRMGTNIKIGEPLTSYWLLQDISNSGITINRNNMTKMIKLKST